LCAHGRVGASTETNEPRAVSARASVTKDERRRSIEIQNLAEEAIPQTRI